MFTLHFHIVTQWKKRRFHFPGTSRPCWHLAHQVFQPALPKGFFNLCQDIFLLLHKLGTVYWSPLSEFCYSAIRPKWDQLMAPSVWSGKQKYLTWQNNRSLIAPYNSFTLGCESAATCDRRSLMRKNRKFPISCDAAIHCEFAATSN